MKRDDIRLVHETKQNKNVTAYHRSGLWTRKVVAYLVEQGFTKFGVDTSVLGRSEGTNDGEKG